MSTDFVHLHVHTDYSMLDGACRVSELAKLAEAAKMAAMACTDHGNMCGAIDFYTAMQDHGVKPIIGCEFYVAPGGRTERNAQTPHVQGFHLVLLAKDEEGYQNLCRLNTTAWLDGFYYKPRIDKDVLATCSQGLIAMSACIGGEIPSHILEGNDALAVKALQDYIDIFGKTDFFLELQDHGMREEARANRRMIELGDQYGVGLVATNDAHYLKREHAQAHDVLLCIGTQATVDDAKRLRFPGPEFYLKSAEEMAALFRERPDALANTWEIAQRCELKLKLGEEMENHYPVFPVPDTVTREAYLRQICIAAIPARYGFALGEADLTAEQQGIVERMDYELGVIGTAGFTSYFLVVWDFLSYAHREGIPVGPGRGSGAGSIVAYLTHITDIDPLRYGLLFERFLNPDRVSPPDFDIDLCEKRRQDVIAYVRDKYGPDSVAQIGTFGTLKTKAVLKDVTRALGRPFADGNALTKMIPPDLKMTLELALEKSAELREFQEREEWVGEVITYSHVLEGLNRNMSIHAAGVIIGDQPLASLVPLARGSGDEVITQYPAPDCESLGLLKMDFLGLRTLTIIQATLDLIKQNRGVDLKSSEIPLDDEAAYDLLNKGNTIGVFQLESGGMRDLCRRFGVHRIEDVIALIALYRPGPMKFLDEFISRKMGQTPIEYDVPEMEPILAETYGIMLYQEQVMQVVQKVAGFSLGQADILRRAMGKKKITIMEEQFAKFVAGCAGNNIDLEVATAIWEKVAMFAGYGFNKSHSAAYGVLSCQTAYLKANYPVEFMAAVLSSEVGNADKLAFFLRECREMGIDVRPPDVNTSDLDFAVASESICFGLGAIKGVGGAAANEIIKARTAGPEFTDLVEFCERASQGLNRRVMENLCKAGAFDCLGLKRSQVFAMIDEALGHAQQAVRDRQAGQGSLFDMLGEADANPFALVPPDIPEWEPFELLSNEKALIGFYVTGHPLTEHEALIMTFELHSVGTLSQMTEETVTRTGGIINLIDLKRSKRDQRQWAIMELEGFDGTIECLVFADAYEKYGAMLEVEAAVFVEATLSSRDGDRFNLIVERVIPVADAPELLTREVHVRLHQASSGNGDLERLKALCEAHPGETDLVLCIICASGDIAFVKPAQLTVTNAADFRQGVIDIFGAECLWQKPDRNPEVNFRSRQRRPPAHQST